MGKKNKQSKAHVVDAKPMTSSGKNDDEDVDKSEDVVEGEPVLDDNDDCDDDDEYEDDELELLQVDLGDMVKLKQVLDEAVAGVILEKVEEDYRWDNCKLAIMTVACLFAVLAQFSPIPFPESRPLLGICGCAYFILSGVLQLIATFIDKDTILLTKSLNDSDLGDSTVATVIAEPNNKSSKNNSKNSSNATVENKLMQENGIRVRSSLPRFSEWYTVILEYQMNELSPFVEQRWSVGQFFDKEGYFDEVGLIQEIETLFKKFEEEKYSTLSDEEKKNQ